MSRGEWFLKFQMKATKLLASKKEETQPAEKQPSKHRGPRSSRSLTALLGKSLPVWLRFQVSESFSANSRLCFRRMLFNLLDSTCRVLSRGPAKGSAEDWVPTWVVMIMLIRLSQSLCKSASSPCYLLLIYTVHNCQRQGFKQISMKACLFSNETEQNWMQIWVDGESVGGLP